MKRTIITLLAVMGLWMPFGSGDTGAQTISNSSYTAVPPFVNNNATPNVLILLDNSGSMGRRANCQFSTGADGNACPIFNETVTYGGLFDTFLDNLPEGERQFHNCQACRRFTDAFGGLVTVDASRKNMRLLLP